MQVDCQRIQGLTKSTSIHCGWLTFLGSARIGIAIVTRQMFNQTSLCRVNDIVFASDPEYENVVLLWKAGEMS